MVTNKLWGLERWLGGWECWLPSPPEDPGLVLSSHTQPLTSACDSDSQGLSTLFWLPWVLHIDGVHTNVEAKYSGTQTKSKSNKQTKPRGRTLWLRHGGQQMTLFVS